MFHEEPLTCCPVKNDHDAFVGGAEKTRGNKIPEETAEVEEKTEKRESEAKDAF